MIQRDFQKNDLLKANLHILLVVHFVLQLCCSCSWIKRSAEFCAAARPGLSLTQFVNGKERVRRVVDILGLLFLKLLLLLLLLLFLHLLLLLLLSSIRRPLGPWRRVRPQWTGQTGSEGLQQIDQNLEPPKYFLTRDITSHHH